MFVGCYFVVVVVVCLFVFYFCLFIVVLNVLCMYV